MADQLYQLPYDDEIDKDIHEWLKGLKRSRKAEIVRHAIRFYLTSTGNNPYICMPATQTVPVAAPASQPAQQQEEVVAKVEPPASKPATPTNKKKPSLPLDGQF